MAPIPVEITTRVLNALNEVAQSLGVQSAYIFGSYAAGTSHTLSDVDVGIFVESLKQLPLEREFSLTARVCRHFGSDLEFHLFDASDPANDDPSSFAAEVRRTGVKIA